jgi:hypothetical protein
MGPPLYMQSVVDRNVVTQHMTVLTFERRSADCFIWKPSPYRAVNTFQLCYKTQSVFHVNGTSRCLFLDKFKTHKYSVGREYSTEYLNSWCIP